MRVELFEDTDGDMGVEYRHLKKTPLVEKELHAPVRMTSKSSGLELDWGKRWTAFYQRKAAKKEEMKEAFAKEQQQMEREMRLASAKEERARRDEEMRRQKEMMRLDEMRRQQQQQQQLDEMRRQEAFDRQRELEMQRESERRQFEARAVFEQRERERRSEEQRWEGVHRPQQQHSDWRAQDARDPYQARPAQSLQQNPYHDRPTAVTGRLNNPMKRPRDNQAQGYGQRPTFQARRY